ncbi:MAG: dephospho-CoA kinase [Gemmatimonadota bacterium]
MKIVGLTGNVAAGKSTVAEAWARAGVPVLDADDLAAEALAPGTPGLAEVVEAFGDGILEAGGVLDRAALRERVFRDAEARKTLEAIVHPRVRQGRDAWLDGQRAEGESLVVLEIPLLFETGAASSVDSVVLVDAPEEVRQDRMVRSRGLDPAEARRIMASQMSAADKRTRADHILDNEGDLESLLRGAALLLARLSPDVPDPAVGPPAWDRQPVDGWMRGDLHRHTRASWDCRSDPEALLARAQARGVTRLAFTDHDTMDSALRWAERHPDRIIPGEEVKTAEGIDVIGLYLTEPIPKGTPAREVVDRVREQGGITYLPHPYAAGKGGGGRYAEELAPFMDVVEVFNGRLHPGRLNASAAQLARRYGRLRGAGSDAHTVGEVAGAYVELPRHDSTPDALRKALRRGRPAGRTASHLVHLASTWAKVHKKLLGG